MTSSGENKIYNISANNFTIEESKLTSLNKKNSNCIFETEDI
jgi:hypothetical protein